MTTAFSKVANSVRGCLGRNGRLLLQLSDRKLVQDKTPHSFFVTWDNGRLSPATHVNWTAVATVFTDWPDIEFVAVGSAGQILCFRRDGTTSESGIFAPGHLVAGGPLRGAAVISGDVFAVGAAHQVYRIQPNLTVTDLSVPGQLTRTQPDSIGLEAIAAFDENEIYAVGWEGEIWWRDAGQWRRVGTPTNLILTAVVCAPDEFVYVVGQHGVLLRGRRDQWQAIPSPTDENFWSAAWFLDRLDVASSQQLLTLDGGRLRSVELPDQPETYFSLDSNPRAMLSVGADDVLLLLTDRTLRVV